MVHGLRGPEMGVGLHPDFTSLVNDVTLQCNALGAVFLLRPVFNHDDDLHHNQISAKLRKHYFSCL